MFISLFKKKRKILNLVSRRIYTGPIKNEYANNRKYSEISRVES